MPPADRVDDKTLIRAVIYGPARSKKTWWALLAAKQGFNVHLFDADKGWEIIHQMGLSDEERARINIIDIADTSEPKACFFWAYLLKQRKAIWDEDGKLFQPVEANIRREHGHYLFDLDKLSRNDVVIVDSWTAIVASLFMRYFQETSVDLYDVDDDDRNKRGEFGWTAALANWFLNQMTNLSCHLILIGHETVWEKRGQKVVNGKKQDVIEDVRTQIVSTSGPNARDIIRRFGNALHFSIKLTGVVSINVQASPKEDAGSRLIAPGSYDWDALSFTKLAQLGKVQIPDGNQRSEAVKFLSPDEDWNFESIGYSKKVSLGAIASKPGGSAQVAQVAVEKPVVKPSPFAKMAANKK